MHYGHNLSIVALKNEFFAVKIAAMPTSIICIVILFERAFKYDDGAKY
jgi:hypothetical protein